MKHTICTKSTRLTVEPIGKQSVRITVDRFGRVMPPELLPSDPGVYLCFEITPEQAGLLSQAFDIAAMECGNDGIEAGAAGVAAIEAREGVRG